MEQDKLYKEFVITSVCRADLDSKGIDASQFDDADMERLASKMADAYCDSVFWIDLEILAENILKNKTTN